MNREDLLYENLRVAIKQKEDAKLAMIRANPDEMPECYESFKATSQSMNQALTALSVFLDKLVSVDDTGDIHIGDRGELDLLHD